MFLRSNFKIAFRNFLRSKTFSIINISGLALGLACCIIVYLFVRSESGYDSYHKNKEHVYRLTLDVERLSNNDIWKSATSSILWAPALKKEYPEIVDFARVMPDEDSRTFRVENREFSEVSTVIADKSVFNLFTWNLLNGQSETALAEPNSVVLSQTLAKRFFGEQNPMGRFIETEEQKQNGTGEPQTVTLQLKVTGVMQDIPFKSHLKPDMLVSFITLNDLFGEDVTAGSHSDAWYWRGRTVHNYLLLKSETPAAQLEAKLPGFIDKYVGDATSSRGYVYHPYLQPVEGIHLEGNVSSTFEPGGDKQQIVLFSAIALFVLLVACINFMNLSTARSVNRSREVGVRKVVGASRKSLVLQFLSESLFVSCLSLALALLLVELIRPIFQNYVGKELYLEQSELWSYGAGILALTLLVGIIAGCYPALFLSNFRPVEVLKSKFAPGSKGAVLRKGLVVFQFAITIFFVFASLTIYSQLHFMRNQSLGFKKSQVVVVPPEVNQPLVGQMETVRNQLLANANVTSVSISSVVPGRSWGGDIWGEPGKPGEDGVSLDEFAVDYDFIDLYELELIAGRNFDREMGTDAAAENSQEQSAEIAGIVNEATVKRFGWGGVEDALGKRIMRDPVSNDFTCRIIGVVRDFHFDSLQREIEPMVLFINPAYASNYRHLSVAFSSASTAETIELLRNTYQPKLGETAFDYFFIDEDFARLYEQEQKSLEVSGYIAGLTILIACLGLFGLASFAAEQRTKEVGIRKTLGASVGGIVGLFSRDFIKLIAVAMVIAWPLAYFVLDRWLDSFAYHFEIGPAVFLASGAVALAIALVTISSQAIKAALTNPVDALRYE